MGNVGCGKCESIINFYEQICEGCGEFPTLFFPYDVREDREPVTLEEVRDIYFDHLENPEVVPEWNSRLHSHLVFIEVCLGRNVEARYHANEFLRLQQKLNPDGIGEIQAIATMALLCVKEDDLNKAETLFNTALNMSEQIDYEEGVIGSRQHLKRFFDDTPEP